MGYISDLLQTLVSLGIGQEITRGVHPAGHPHLPGFRDLPQIIVNPVKFHKPITTHALEEYAVLSKC
jgi:hypothetical protein